MHLFIIFALWTNFFFFTEYTINATIPLAVHMIGYDRNKNSTEYNCGNGSKNTIHAILNRQPPIEISMAGKVPPIPLSIPEGASAIAIVTNGTIMKFIFLYAYMATV